MSVAKPQNRAEFKKHILTTLGSPVLEINVADEQMDVAIEDAFQFFNERNHFNGVERVYLSTPITTEFKNFFKGFETKYVDQEGGDLVRANGMVEELTLVRPGSGYPPRSTMYKADTFIQRFRDLTTENGEILLINNENDEPLDGDTLRTDLAYSSFTALEILVNNNKDRFDDDGNIDDEYGDPLETNKGLRDDVGDGLEIETYSDSIGRGLTVKVFPGRDINNGLIRVEPYHTGVNYKVGDYVTIKGGDNNAMFQVSKVKTYGPSFGVAAIREQRNFLVLPDDVVGVTRILRGRGPYSGIGPGLGSFPIMGGIGNISGNNCDNTGHGLSQYWIMQSYLALIEFMFYPPKMYNFNQRTHHLHIDGDLGDIGQTLVLETMVKPSPEVYPDLWNDLWMKWYATALVKAQWGRNLTKYAQVQLPGGIVMNGEKILGDAQEELKTLRERFAMDWADPPLDAVG